jgi:diguanylate cyclase (GGDEF)-like protein
MKRSIDAIRRLEMESEEKRILVVDDTESNIDILVELLSDIYEVMVALDGESAVEIAKEEIPDLILLDIMMPGMDGYEVCRILKSDEKTRDIPIIFITANTSEKSIEKAYDIGGNDYVTKPFRPKELLARVHRELELRKLIEDLERSREEMRLMAITDPMTKLYNRRYFSEISEDIFSVAKRNGHHLGVIMLDIDKFKRINDTYGHQIGDEVIISLANVILTHIRQSDTACRYGGEEFVILLPETDMNGVRNVAEKIRRAVEESKMELPDGVELKYTVSLGITEADFEKDRNVEKVIGRADEALYDAKESGRNRVCDRVA